MKYTHIIWDFNGTILDDVAPAIKSVNTLLSRRNLQTLDTIEDYRKVFTFPIKEYYQTVGFDFEKESYETLAIEWVKEYLANTASTPVHQGLIEILEYFKSINLTQIILSATEKEMLIKQLKNLNILHYFAEVLGLDNIHAHSKEEIGKNWKLLNPNAQCLLIGDTTHDYHVSIAMNCDCILVANGHQNKSTLSKCNCNIIDNITQIKLYL